jgi:dehydrogenase/reductase SDR family member 7B
MSYFKDKIIWITGASSGIGKALCLELAKRGAKIILSARNLEQLEIVKECLINPKEHFVLPLDLENSSNFVELKDKVINRYGKIDLVFNNGGVSQRGEAAETLMSVDRKIMEINFFGNIALTKAVLPVFQKQKSGHIVVQSSIAGKFGFYLRSSYSASKHALHGFYESLLLEEAKNNIFVTLVCPGKINTDISINALSEKGEKHSQMDHNQATGMTAEDCVLKMLKAVEKQKKEVLIGNKEIIAVYIKRFLPFLFWKIIKKQKAT